MILKFIKKLFSIQAVPGKGACKSCWFYARVYPYSWRDRSVFCNGPSYQTPYGNGEEKLGDPIDNENDNCVNWQKK
jgi:hypothetical protein